MGDWIQAAHDLGVPEAIALMFMAGLAWVGVRLFGRKSGILTRLGHKGERFFERYIGLADTLEPAIQRQTENSEKMLDLHRDPSAPCNTLPLRRAGIAAADALEAIAGAVQADVAPQVAVIKAALEPSGGDDQKDDGQPEPHEAGRTEDNS